MSSLALLTAAVLVPVALALFARQRALRPLRHGERPAFFALAQQVQWIGIVATLAWLPAAVTLVFPALFARELPPGIFLPAFGLAILGPPFIVLGAMGLVVHEVAARAGVTDWTWFDAIGELLLLLVGALAPLVLLLAAMDAVRVGLFREATFATVAGVAIAIAAAGTRARKQGLTPHAVTHGALRDRIVALARQAGVELRQLYVVPFRRFRMANAFAVQGNVVTLTDLLLRELDRDQVDAILAHEMAHLARRDPRTLAVLAIATFAVPMLVGSVAGYGVAAATLVVLVLAQLAYRRRMEHATDARAITFDIRPEALVTGLARLHRPRCPCAGRGVRNSS